MGILAVRGGKVLIGKDSSSEKQEKTRRGKKKEPK